MTTELIIPMELTHNAGEIPAATVSRLIPEVGSKQIEGFDLTVCKVEAANESLSDAGKERMKMSSTPSIAKQQAESVRNVAAVVMKHTDGYSSAHAGYKH